MTSTAQPSPVVPRGDAATALDQVPAAIPLSVTMIDLDGFAGFNEANGRQAGDHLLGAFQQAVDNNLPPEAKVFRIGGDEWVVGLPGSPLENSLVLVEELRGHIEAAQLGAGDGRGDHRVTMSAGLAARPPHGETADELLRAADEALSRAKREGRNRVGIFIEDKMVMKSNYYPRATLDRLAALSRATNRTEASLLREAADHLLARYAGEI